MSGLRTAGEGFRPPLPYVLSTAFCLLRPLPRHDNDRPLSTPLDSAAARCYIPSAMSRKVRGVLAELRRRLEELYGDRLVKLVLFGSQARGTASTDSDVDVLVVLRGPIAPSAEIHRASPVTAAVSLENDVVISCVYVSEERYKVDNGPLLLNVRAEGVPV